ncbi:nucleotidyltransferase domain-containing protein [Streptomyces sp. NPDC059247]|uniref:nucleotidyltransferase domain-containing protein n=1 Tax=Streptomyces sp. NPDC059247 TaxID=3346790 RepID=UPI00367928CD
MDTIFAEADFPRWIAGGYAIELAVGRELRAHGDLDILVPAYGNCWPAGTSSCGPAQPRAAESVASWSGPSAAAPRHLVSATRDKDGTDFEAALPLLDAPARAWPAGAST